MFPFLFLVCDGEPILCMCSVLVSVCSTNEVFWNCQWLLHRKVHLNETGHLSMLIQWEIEVISIALKPDRPNSPYRPHVNHRLGRENK